MDSVTLEMICSDHIQSQRPEAGIQAVQESLKEAPGDPSLLGLLGCCQAIAGKNEEAIASLRDARARFEALAGSDESKQRNARIKMNNIGAFLLRSVKSEIGLLAATSRLLVEGAGWEHYEALRWIGEALRRDRQLVEAERHFQRSLAQKPDYGQCWLDLAVTSASLGRRPQMLEAIRNATRFGIRKTEVAEGEPFRAFAEDPDFLELVDRLPRDPTLRETYRALHDEAYERVLELGNDALATFPDKLALLEPMAVAAKCIVDDIEEHGNTDADPYPHDADHYDALRRRLRGEISDLRDAGATSDVFARYAKP